MEPCRETGFDEPRSGHSFRCGPWRRLRSLAAGLGVSEQPVEIFLGDGNGSLQGNITSGRFQARCTRFQLERSLLDQQREHPHRSSAALVTASDMGAFAEIECGDVSHPSPLEGGLIASVSAASGPSERRTDPQGTEDRQRNEQDQYTSRKSDEKIAIGIVDRVVAEYVPSQQREDGNACRRKEGEKS